MRKISKFTLQIVQSEGFIGIRQLLAEARVKFTLNSTITDKQNEKDILEFRSSPKTQLETFIQTTNRTRTDVFIISTGKLNTTDSLVKHRRK